jgi:hypothetical protein
LGGLFVLVLAAGLFGVSLFASFSWVWRTWLLAGAAWLTLNALTPRLSMEAEGEWGHALAVYLGQWVLGILLLILFLRVVVLATDRIWRYFAKELPPESGPSSDEDSGFFLLVGLVLGPAVFVRLAWALSGQPDGFWIHGLVTLLGAAGIALLGLALKHRGSAPRASGFAIGVLSIVTSMSLLGTFYPALVTASASSLANASPHCIALKKRERPAQSLQDLTFFTMDKSEVRYHAVLLIERNEWFELYAWSYFSWGFVEVARNMGRVGTQYCIPEPRFISELPLLQTTKPSSRGVFFNGVRLQLPEAYRWKLFDDSMHLNAQPPHFGPSQTRDADWGKVSIRVPARESSGPFGYHEALEANMGDTQELADGPDQNLTRQGYLGHALDGTVATVIKCRPAGTSNGECEHGFDRDGLIFKFSYPRSDLPGWREMEERLFALYKSWVIAPPQPTASDHQGTPTPHDRPPPAP